MANGKMLRGNSNVPIAKKLWRTPGSGCGAWSRVGGSLELNHKTYSSSKKKQNDKITFQPEALSVPALCLKKTAPASGLHLSSLQNPSLKKKLLSAALGAAASCNVLKRMKDVLYKPRASSGEAELAEGRLGL